MALQSPSEHGRVLPAIQQEMLNNLRGHYANRLEILSLDSEWIVIRVTGMTEEVLLRDLERNAGPIFGKHLNRFRIVRALNDSDRGVAIGYLTGINAMTTPSGFWYY